MVRLLTLASLLLTLGVGCSDTVGPPPPRDQGPGILDGSGGTEDDFDGDGLCNVTEMGEGTDPLNPDSDGDGFPDRAERTFGYDPLDGSFPSGDEVHLLRETTTSTLQVAFEQVVSAGDEYGGAFDAVEVFDLADQDAATFYRGSVATFAEPPENVAELDETGQTFRGVVGRTLLGFEVRFAFEDALPRGCIRGYPFVYTVKRADGVRVAIFRDLLLVLPMGATLETGGWCSYEGGCI